MPVQITEYTYGTAIAEIAKLVGHTTTAPPDPVGSTDPAIQQMASAINVALEELLTMHEWQDLTVKTELSVVGASAGLAEQGYNLPADFYRFIDQSQWSSTSIMPAGGPVSNQAWMASVVQSFSSEFTLNWQMREDQIWFLNPPFPVPALFKYMYLSKAQVIDGSDPTLFKNKATLNSDTFKLDSQIIMLLGRARYLEWKGFDASAAVRDFLAIFNSRAGADKGAGILSLCRRGQPPLIGPQSLPNTGYGS